MADPERPRLGGTPVQGDPLRTGCAMPTDQKNSVLSLSRAVEPSCGSGVCQLAPGFVLINITSVPEAGDQLSGDEVYSRAVLQVPWVVVEDTAPGPLLPSTVCW